MRLHTNKKTAKTKKKSRMFKIWRRLSGIITNVEFSLIKIKVKLTLSIKPYTLPVYGLELRISIILCIFR